MKANFHHKPEGGLSVTFDGAWNALSLFLESDSCEHAMRHINAKKKEAWMGNISILKLKGEGKYELSSELATDASTIVVSRAQLLRAIDEWNQFRSNKNDKVVNL